MSYTGASGARAKSFTSPMSTKIIINVQLNMGLSIIGMKKFVKIANQTSNAKLVQPNFHISFQMAGRQLSDFFNYSEMKSPSGNGDTA